MARGVIDLGVGRGTTLRRTVSMLEKIEYATRQALAARQKAAESLDNAIREQWGQVAQMWEDLIRELRDLQPENTEAPPR